MRPFRYLVALAALALAGAGVARAADPPVEATASEPREGSAGAADPTPAASAAPAVVATPPATSRASSDTAARDYYVKARGYRLIPDTDPPKYVRPAAKTGWPLLAGAPWLDIGLEHRTRFEYRENSFLRTPQEGTDYPFLLRTRMFVGIHNLIDPLRAAVELQDSEWANSIYPNTNREVNQVEPIQLYGELFFENVFNTGRPGYIRGGRMAFELVDRRLIANNEFRNTTNTFQGVRAHVGRLSDDWELDIIGVQPLDRLMYEFDEGFDSLWLYGMTGTWRRQSEIATVQPYWFGLTQGKTNDVDSNATFSIQTTGVRAFGIIGATGWDWDVDVAYQFGDWVKDQRQAAGAFATELGYTVANFPWTPRASAFFAYGTGDRDPNDGYNNSFNSLYGFNQPWSRNDYFSWDNVIMPKARLQLAPLDTVAVELGYGAFWLASATAAWQRAQLRDPTGRSGNFLGNEFDFRIKYQVLSRVMIEASYAYFNPGRFPSSLGKPLASNFFYLQVNLSAFP